MKLLFRLFLYIVFTFIFTFNKSYSNDNVQVGGNFLSVFNSLNQKDQPDNQSKELNLMLPEMSMLHGKYQKKLPVQFNYNPAPEKEVWDLLLTR